MRAASLVIVLLVARVAGLMGQPLPHSASVVPVLLWQDVAVGLVFWTVDRLFGRPRAMWMAYWIVVTWAAIDVPVVRALASPLTVPMLHAAGGPMLDSIAYYATTANLLAMSAVILAGAATPVVVGRIPRGPRAAAAIAMVALAAIAPLVSSRVDVHGLDRNAVTAITTTMMPRVRAEAGRADWRVSPFGERDVTDLSTLRGTATGRNIVLIVLESTAAEYLRSFGAADDPTPNLTALAAHALQFDAAYAVYPESIKGLFATLCSREPAFDVGAEQHAKVPCASMARTLAHAGYRTGLFHSGRFAYLGMDVVLERQGFDTLEDAGAIGGVVRSSFGVDEPSTVHRLLSWIDQGDASQPFFLVYLPTAGHHPYATPDAGPFQGRGEFSAYQNALAYGDRAIGELLGGLRDRHLDDRTMVVVMGDHGEAFAQHDGNAGHTFFLYEENVHVPLIVTIPGVTTETIHVTRGASAIDVAPTVLDLAGVAIPATYRGASLLAASDRMALFFTDYSLGWWGLRDGCWKYLYDLQARRSRLFDLCEDPAETIDRALGQPVRAAAYRARLQAWTSAAREGILSARP